MKNKILQRRIIFLSVVAVAGIFAALIFYNIAPKPINLPYVEINNYNGTKLDSVNDFRENSIKGVQHVDISNYQLKIYGLVENPKNYSYDDIINNYQSYKKIVRLNCVEGWSAKILWQGILIKDLFDEAKPLPDAKTIIFHAYDGYTVNYPADYFSEKKIIMAYKMNNVTIPNERGFPFVLVAEDKWGYKWIKWITEIEFSNNEDYTGYWESRGYSKEGNLNESFFE